MATGDIKNNLRKLLAELKQIRYPECSSDESVVRLDIKALASGIPQAFLPILHFAFLDYSYSLSEYLTERDYELYAKTDLKFIAVVYRILRDEFSFKPQLTKEQFLSLGFAEQKIILVSKILKMCRDKHIQLNSKENRLERKKAKLGAITSVCTNTSLKKTGSSFAGESKSNPPRPKKSVCQSEVKFTQSLMMKPLLPPKHPRNNRTNATASTSKKDVYPAPLLVNTEMNTFHTNEEAQYKFGLSSSYPLVTREVQDDYKIPQEENKENCQNNTEVHGLECFPIPDMIETNVLQAVQYDQQSTSSTDTSGLRLQKSVRWEDEMQNTTVSDVMTSRDHFASAPSNFALFERISKQTVPAPVTMTTVPKPSPDLMLTPIGKASPVPIPLSATCGHFSESSSISKSLVDVSGSDNIEQDSVQVIRHPHTAKMLANKKRNGELVARVATEKPDDAGKYHKANYDKDLVKYQLTEVQEKLDHLLSLNNQMSSRIVLLETRVKLLEEGQSNGLFKNCNSPNQSESCQQLTLRGFSFQNPTEVNSFATQTCENDVVYAKGINDLHTVEIPQIGIESDITRISSDDLEGGSTSSDEECVNQNSPVQIHVSGKDQQESSHSHTASVMHTPKVSFVDSSTKATVLNVHKRLKETREMLTRTNKTFATRFSQASSSENV